MAKKLVPTRSGAGPSAQFVLMEEEAHQPFQEIPDAWNARVDEFWREAERLHSGMTRS